IDEAERLRVDLCVDCNLCTYICPSKIEIQKQFHEAELQLEEEKNLNP
ncbi:MAG: electron transport complex subunit C, partial [Spirochaetes bacterium]